jgi:TolA-binding protein/sugar lactone lactonase YvrE
MRVRRTLSTVAVTILTLALFAVPAQLRTQAPSRDEAAIQRLMLEADRREQEGDLAGALRDYELLVQQFPESPQAAEALLRLARGRFRGGDPSGAEEAARQLVDRYRRASQAAGAFVLLAELQASRATQPADLVEARANFRNVWVLFGPEAYPNLSWRAVARVRSGELALLLGALDEAAASFVVAMEDEPASQWTGRAGLGLAGALLERGEWAAAAQTLQSIVDGAGDDESPSASAARRRLTLIHRFLVRPTAGEKRWQSARQLSISGLALKRPAGLAADDAGRLVISDEKVPVLAVVGAEGRVLTRESRPSAKRPCFASDGTVYVASGETIALPLTKGRQEFVDPGTEKQVLLRDMVAAERGTFGDWFVLTGKPPRVLLFGPDGAHRQTLVDASGHEAIDLARDSRDRLYVLDRKANSVLRFSADGQSQARVFSGSWKRAEALTVDLLGNLYVLDGKEGRIDVYSPAGQRLESVGPQLPGGIQLRAPLDLAVDGSGRLYIADAKLAAVVVLE